MNKEEAKSELARIVAQNRKHSYEYWVSRIDEQETYEFGVSSGVKYQVEIQAFWDDGRKRRNVRVLFAIDDGGLRAFYPLAASFIIAPDGSFVGE